MKNNPSDIFSGGIYDKPGWGNPIGQTPDSKLPPLPPHLLPTRCAGCNSLPKVRPHPLGKLPFGAADLDVCHECEIKLGDMIWDMLDGFRRLRGLEPLPRPARPGFR